jgi:prolipoprotein diacylglyceryl transferase
MTLATIPSPTQGVWDLGPLPIRAYALCIVAGIVAAILLTEKRWVARGGAPGDVLDIAVWAVPFGIVGGRLYHVVSSPRAYFGENGDPLRAFAIWEGGLGIWGGVALGALVGWYVARRRGCDATMALDACAPAIALAQAIGRWGNWFNQELFGRPTSLPWGLRIDPVHRPDKYLDNTTFHPTFLYESLWCLLVIAVVLVVERRYRMRPGGIFAVYVATYTVGRAWIEALRIDDAHHILGLRLNDWVSLAVFLAAVAIIIARRPAATAVDQSANATPG